MVDTKTLGSDVTALGELIGLLKASGADTVTFDTAWFDDPLTSLESIDTRLDELVALIDGILGPGLDSPPDVFSGARWYPIPNPSTGGPTPFCIVTTPPTATSGQIGLGVDRPILLGNLTIQAFAYVPLFRYGPSGAQFIADSVDDPSQIGLYVTTSDAFTVGGVTFTAMKIEGEIFLADKLPTFNLTFENLKGTTKPATYTSLSGLLEPDVLAWIGEVIVQGSYWLNLYVGTSDITVGQVLMAAHFLTQDDKGQYQLSLTNLKGQSATEIALNFVFAGLDALATLDVPLVPLPGGGIYVASEESTGDYGVRFAADLSLASAQPTNGKTPPSIDISLGTWFTGETDATSWLSRIAGGSPRPGLSVYLLRRDPTSKALSFTPSFELASVGINVRGTRESPLVNLSGYTLQGAEVRGYLSSQQWDFGFGARLDAVGFPLGPSFQDAQNGSKGNNVVAKNLVASNGQEGGQGDTTGQTSAVNPGFSAEAGYVKGHPPLLEVFDLQDQDTDLIWFPIQRRFGPLNAEKIGLRVDVTGTHASDPLLGLIFDGGVMLSVLDIELDELSITVHLKDAANTSGYSLDLKGLSLAFDSGAVEISGGLLKNVDPSGFVAYDGEALIKFGGQAIAALGSFGSLPTGGTSLFVFAALDAPLGGPAFFFVTGVAAGFGFNRGLLLPAQGAVQSFPLVAALAGPSIIGGDNASPATVLMSLDRYVPPRKGEYWLAAGIQFTSFELINTNALLVVEFGKEFVISVLGLATLRQPQIGEAYVYAELDIEVIFAPQQGVFKASAALSTSSYVLVKEAHLTGGFAAYGWFGKNAHAGEFVLTLGGYHPAFKVPAYYPREARVGINWRISNVLQLVGGAYLAITPTAMMAGGLLQITFQDGPLKAWLKAQADAILYYKPFYLIADASVSVGVSYRVDALFVHKTFTVEIGATFHLVGPPIGGTVHVDWYIISFTISFGQKAQRPAGISWDDFKTLLPSKTQETAPTAPAAGALGAAATTTTTPAYLTIGAKAGLLSKRTVDGLTLWLVRAEQLELAIESAIPASTIVVASEKSADNLTIPGTKVGIRRVNGDVGPDDYQSDQTVTILSLSSDSLAHIKACMATTSPCTGQPAGCADPPITVTDWHVEPVTSPVPEAMWGAPVPKGKTPNINSSTPTISATTGVTMSPKPPVITACTPELVIDQIFDDRTVNLTDAYRLPLSQTRPPSTNVPQAADSFKDIANVNDAATVANRDGLFAALQGLGVSSWTNDPLPELAANPGRGFADEPLEGAPVLVS